MKVYVATIETRYTTIAVGTTEENARRLAGRHALRWLKEQGVTDFKSANAVLDYFACTVTECELDGSATVC